MKILARHKWVEGATITESASEDGLIRCFTATIRGWRNWKLYEGRLSETTTKEIIQRAKQIRDRIDSGDESVFNS